MIVTRMDGALRVVMQVDHQVQCAHLMAAWGNTGFARPDPWDDLVEAAARHDEGWRAWEEHPQVRVDGAPQGFDAMDIDDHVAIHRRSTASAASAGDRVALLVGMHCEGLLLRRLGLDDPVPALADRPAPVRRFIVDQASASRARRERLGEGAALAGWSWMAYRVLQAIDLLSLYLTWRGLAADESWTLRRVPRAAGDERGADIAAIPVDALTCGLEPWPFATDVVQAPVRAAVIADRAYRDADDLSEALGAAQPEVLPLRVVPSART